MTSKDLLKQYVDTGLKIGQYQVESLPQNLLKTYARKRLMAMDHNDKGIEEYEFNVMPTEYKIQYLKKVLDLVKKDERRPTLLLFFAYKKSSLEEWELNQLGKYLGGLELKNYLIFLVNKIDNIKSANSVKDDIDYKLYDYEYKKIGEILGEKYQKKYIKNRILNGNIIEKWEFNTLDFDEKVEYVKSVIDRNLFTDNLFTGPYQFIEDFYVEHMGGKRSEYKKNGSNWDVPRPPQEDNQVYESIERFKQILGYDK